MASQYYIATLIGNHAGMVHNQIRFEALLKNKELTKEQINKTIDKVKELFAEANPEAKILSAEETREGVNRILRKRGIS